jgi:hypothetical protein
MSDLEVKSVLKTERQEGGHWEASIEGVGAAAHGETRAEAVEGLCCLLGDFVKGHAGTIDQLQKELLAAVELPAGDPNPIRALEAALNETEMDCGKVTG